MLRIIFKDNTIFKSKNVYDSKWNEMPNKPIKSFEYEIIGHKLVLTGYDGYNHLIEHYTVFNTMKEGVSKIILMALNIIFLPYLIKLIIQEKL